MVVTWHLDETELDENFYRRLKDQFKNKKLSVTVAEEMDETEYLLSSPANAEHLLNAIANSYKKDNLISVDLGELKRMID